MPRPPVKGRIIDGHVHLLARRHADVWFEAADHFGLDHFITQSPLEEAVLLQRDFGHRLTFVAVPNWMKLAEPNAGEDWLRRIEAFHNLGARMAKIHLSPGTMQRTKFRFDHPTIQRVLKEIRDRGMIIMTHIGDPQIWYEGRYRKLDKPEEAFLADRTEQYRLWEEALEASRGTPWLGAHLGGWPENLGYLQGLFDRFPDLVLDLSATRWMVRELSTRRDEARDFILRNPTRILWGSDQVSGDARDWDFLASRWWCHRKLFETGYADVTPILDPDLPDDQQPVLRGLALPGPTLQLLYRENARALMGKVGVTIE
ncbi:MAG: amidohydrolase family protein [Tepidisphaeraceae bacterium]